MRQLFSVGTVVILLCLVLDLSAQVAGPRDGLVVIGKVDTIASTILGEDRQVWVSVPESGNIPGKKYPVIYLLDGDAHFYSMMGLVHQISSVNGNAVCPEMIVVGILNTDRMRDMTPTAIQQAFGDTLRTKTSGGLINFTNFIEKELIPYIDANYPTTSHKTYVGHSLGGLAVIHTYLKKPMLFKNYLAIDPSLWWDNGMINNIVDTIRHPENFTNTSLYVAMANTLPEGMTMHEANRDTAETTEHARAIIKFCSVMDRKRSDPGRSFKWKYYEQEDHSLVPLRAEFDGLRYLFSWFNLDHSKIEKFTKPGSTATLKEFQDLIIGHYQNASDKFGYKVLPDEIMMNSLGYQFVEAKRNDFAFYCFDLNIKNYPMSANTYDSMGDYYVTIGDKAKAKQFFAKAVEIGDLSYSKEKLAKLENEK